LREPYGCEANRVGLRYDPDPVRETIEARQAESPAEAGLSSQPLVHSADY